MCALACALILSCRTFAIGHLGHWAIWGSSSWTRPAHISSVAMEIAPGLEMKAPSAIHRVDEQLFRLEGCRKTPALMCSWRGPSLHAQGFPSQKHSNALKKVKSWRGLAMGQTRKLKGKQENPQNVRFQRGKFGNPLWDSVFSFEPNEKTKPKTPANPRYCGS